MTSERQAYVYVQVPGSLTVEGGRQIFIDVVDAVRAWRDRFLASGVSPRDVAYIAPAFLPECFFFEKPPESTMQVDGRR